MVVYVIAGLVLLVLLFMAYRVLGRPATPVQHPVTLLRSVVDAARDVTADLTSLERGPVLDAPAAAEQLRRLRRSLDGCAQGLDRLDSAALDAPLADAHRLLAQAVEELVWNARMAASPSANRGGLQTAAMALLESASGALSEAARLLAAETAAEEAHSPG